MSEYSRRRAAARARAVRAEAERLLASWTAGYHNEPRGYAATGPPESWEDFCRRTGRVVVRPW